MKKLVLVVLLMLLSVSLFANDLLFGANTLLEDILVLSMLDTMIDDASYAELAQLSPDEYNDFYMYNLLKSNPLIPFACNITMGLGLGSFMQGDVVGGSVGLFSDIGSAALIIGSTYLDPLSKESNTLTTSAVVLFLASRVFQVIRPFAYANEHNRLLKEEIFTAEVVSSPEYKFGLRLGAKIALG